MSFYEFDETAATVEGGSGGSKVLDTGVYDVTITTASKSIASTGTTGIDWNIMVPGSKYGNMIYGMWTINAQDKPIDFNMRKVQALMGIVGAKKLTEFNKEIDVKDGKKTVVAYKEFDGVQVKVAIKKVLDVYNGEVTEKNEIEAFFTADGKTYAETVKGAEAKQIKWYEESMKDKETDEYKKFMHEKDEDEESNDTSTSSGGSLL